MRSACPTAARDLKTSSSSGVNFTLQEIPGKTRSNILIFSCTVSDALSSLTTISSEFKMPIKPFMNIEKVAKRQEIPKILRILTIFFDYNIPGEIQNVIRGYNFINPR